MIDLNQETIGHDPFAVFSAWFEEARRAEPRDPEAMALASVDALGMPSVRIVLLKQIMPEGFVFYTNYESRKGAELLATGKASFVLHWKSLRRQIRAGGAVRKISAAQSDAYFASRPLGSRLGAWASKQSRPLADRASLEAQVKQIQDQYGADVPRPPHWGGFLIAPDEIEFWEEGENRLHNRFKFVKTKQGTWEVLRLYP